MTETEKILQLLATIPDPEIPVISIIDLGIVRHVRIQNNIPEVTITPTYTGCPAMDMIAVDIKAVLQENGYSETHIKTVLSPAWTTKWLSAATKEKLRAYGIAPPMDDSEDKSVLFAEEKKIPCPQCNSANTELVSQFGSTACKALYRCRDCSEPFDYFKCH